MPPFAWTPACLHASGFADCARRLRFHEMGKRRLARELAIQVQFHLDFNGGDPDEVFRLICDAFKAPSHAKAFAKELVTGLHAKREEVDRAIAAASINWRMERMSRTDKSILRLAVYEMMFLRDVPPKVSIDEAVELGKKFGGEDSARFINGVLDHVYNHMPADGREPPEAR
jgi:transcription antitermination factor NusB